MNLKNKLISLILLLALAIILPISYITYKDLSAHTLNIEKEKFTTFIDSAFENILLQYIDLTNNKVNDVIKIKQDMKGISDYTSHSINLIEQQKIPQSAKLEGIIGLIKHDFNSQNIIHLHIKSERLNNPIPLMKEANREEIYDIQGRDLNFFLDSANLPNTGTFAVFSLERNNNQESYLAYFYPLRQTQLLKNAILISYTSIEYLNIIEQREIKNIIATMQESFSRISLYDNSFITLTDKDNAILALKTQNIEVDKINSIQEIDSEGYFVQSAHFKALDWNITTGVANSELEKLGQEIIKTQLTFSFIITTIALILSLFLLFDTLKPLNKLTNKIRELSQIDLSSNKKLNEFASTLPSIAEENTKDEISILNKNFKILAEKLSEEIEKLFSTTKAKERMEGELNAARDIQMGILNNCDNTPHANNLSSAFFLEPAKEVGGDLYDYFQLENGKYVFVIGDVSGKGVPAALFMSMTVTLIRYALLTEKDFAKAIKNTNTTLASHNELSMFVTLFICIFDAESGEFEYVNGGHCQPLIINQQTKEFRLLEEISGPVIGAFEDLDYTIFKGSLHEDELFLATTDGVSEAMNENDELYSDEKLNQFLKDHYDKTPNVVIKDLYQSILDFRQSALASDDITIFAFNRKG